MHSHRQHKSDFVTRTTVADVCECVAFLEKTLEVPIELLPVPEGVGVVPSVLPRIKKMVLADRMVWKRATLAFVSYIRAYKEHKCHYLLPFKLLPIGALATSFSLLQLPKMPELRDVHVAGFQPTQLDMSKLRYKSPQLERQRKEKLRLAKEKPVQKPARLEPLQEPLRGKRAPPAAAATDSDADDSDQEEEDIDDLMEDYRQLKKLKKRKISQREYARRTGEDIEPAEEEEEEQAGESAPAENDPAAQEDDEAIES